MQKIFSLVLLTILISGCNYLFPTDGTGEEGVTYIDITELVEGEMPVEEEVIIQEEVVSVVKETPTLGIIEGDLVEFPNLKATDPDGDKIYYTFSKPLDDKGEWQTSEGDAGEYTVTITASDGTVETKQEVNIIVETRNKAPVLEKIKDITIKEGETVKLSPKALDPEGQPLTITYSGWMTSDTKELDFNSAGEYIVRITVSDGEKQAHQDVKITVEGVNRAPQFVSII